MGINSYIGDTGSLPDIIGIILIFIFFIIIFIVSIKKNNKKEVRKYDDKPELWDIDE